MCATHKNENPPPKKCIVPSKTPEIIHSEVMKETSQK